MIQTIENIGEVKVLLDGEIPLSHTLVNGCASSFQGFVLEAAKTFGFEPELVSNGTIKVGYEDQCGDWILVATDEELAAAFQYKNLDAPLMLRLNVQHRHRNQRNQKFSKEERYKRNQERKNERLIEKINRTNVFPENGISDPALIQMYIEALLYLFSKGSKKTKLNVKTMVKYQKEGMAFNEALLRLEAEEQNRKETRRINREERNGKKRKRSSRRNENYSDEMEEDNAEVNDKKAMEKEQRDNAIFTAQDSWPVNVTHLFIDGNNLLYMTKSLRNNTLKRKMGRSQDMIIAATEFFANQMNGLVEVFVIFDNISSTQEKTLANGAKLFVLSARPNFATTDDMVVHWAQQNKELSPQSLHISSDRALCGRLSMEGALVMKPKHFFSLVLKLTNQEEENLDSWFSKLEENNLMI